VEASELRGALERLAANHRWTWRTVSQRVLGRLPTAAPRLHPVAAVRRLDESALEALAADERWVADLRGELQGLDALVSGRPDPDVAYFSPEFAVTELMPQYSGGLGILAGDHLKSASDLGLSLVGVGLFYHHGFFRQIIKGGGQSELYERHDPVEFGCADTGLTVSVPMTSGEVYARVWSLDVGASRLLLLDTDVPENSPEDVAICDRLYGSERPARLRQELLLGVGGMRAVRAMGWDPSVVHLNEGHAGFVVLPMLDEELEGESNLTAATARVKSRIVFTTHTPVPAGIELFDRSLVEPYLAAWAERWGVGVESLLELAADPSAGTALFNMTALCLRHSRAANGVSRLHGEVSRELFRAIPGGDAIGSITNGVHARSWTHPELQHLFDRHLGPGWSDGDAGAWRRAADVPSDELLRARAAASGLLADVMEQRTGLTLDRDALVVGFARRFAPYKRATLLLAHVERLLELLGDRERPVQMVFAGKAHPADDRGKALLADLVQFSRRPEVSGRFVFVPGYDMEVARAMLAGSDVWLNTPVRGREASGTSGEKAVLNGGLNCSILDGWWAEMYDGRNGWKIDTSTAADEAERDRQESANALAALEEIRAVFFDSYDEVFVERIKHGWVDLGPKITAARMVAEYRDRMYRLPR
jgi:starch phosphorylase